MSDTPKRTIDFMSGYWNVDHPIKEFCAKMELELIKAEKERDEAMAEIQRLRLDAQREAEQHDRMVKELEGLYDQLAKTKSSEHICSLSKDMMGNCIICDG